MPSNTIYQKYADLADKAGVKRNSKAAIDWFRKRIRKDRPIMLDKATEGLKTKGIEPGNLYIYGYNPKYEKTLKYYDNFPCCLVLETTKDGWYGLNLHYLAPTLRAKFLDALLDITNNKAYDDTTKFQARYNILQKTSKLRFYKPCFKLLF